MAETKKTVVATPEKKNHNKQTYLSKVDRLLMIQLVNVEIDKVMSEPVTRESMSKVFLMNQLVDKLNAKLNA